jgi:RNA polymerase sigma-70 factor (ECF subfamily)
MSAILDDDLGLGIVAHAAALRRYALLLMRTTDQADDLVQDCVARALSRAHLYRPDTNLRAWLFTILRNIFITQTRKAKNQRDYVSDCLARGPVVALPNQFHTVALKESLQLMQRLPVQEREAVALLGIYEMTCGEAAQHAGANIGTIKSRTSRGRAHLRQLALPEDRQGGGTPIGETSHGNRCRHRAACSS